MDLLVAEARMLLDAGRDRVPVDGKRLVAFAPKRALELAAVVARNSAEANGDREAGRT
jgi:hypothetical protein